MKWLRKISKVEPAVALSWWLYERGVVLAALASGGAISWMSSFTDWMAPWGPLGWLAAGLATSLFVAGVLTLIRMGMSWKRSKDALVEFTERHVTSTSVNPLKRDFSEQRVNLWDFYHPYFEENREKTFRNCELMGPCNISLSGITQMPRAKLRDCDFVIVGLGKPMKGVVAFADCSFIDCAFYRVTFFVDAGLARSLKSQMLATGVFEGDEPINVISDGTFGAI